MGNVPPTPASRSQSLPVTRPPSETSSTRRYGRQSLPSTNIMQSAKKRLRKNLEQVRQSTPSFRSVSSTADVLSQQSTPSVCNSDTSYFHPNYKSLSSDQLVNTISQQNRPFHNFGNAKYSLPCDEEEQDRMMTLHFLVKHMFNGNFSAPVSHLMNEKRPNGEKFNVLDVGCGPGTWTLEMATEYPEADFYGMDIAEIYPKTIKPANSFFLQDDILTCTQFKDEMFDYIFVRHVYGCFSVVEWDILMKVLLRLLKPGGYVEFREINPMVQDPGPITADIVNTLFITTLRTTRNIDPALAQHLTSIITNAGFADLHHELVKVGSGWGECGDIALNNLASAIKAYGIWLGPAIGINTGELEKRIGIILEEGPLYRSYFNWHMAWARKPQSNYHGDNAAEWEGINDFIHGYVE
ncbi:hypothetical protein K450DRAFT_223226 [Umbelopsis ramanniana AG]|uniref:Methyltransferase domain-containing protein n=1 Tax=Umbelopsis ramanniana AG TaxID=1314678 RepID=A0AAD5EHK2_UMBRA|nr:uncharacterized protein K450DRAFT_223226 [Umbelopsis ramanniana AG]KAI8583354.1 hypothetical protein K450DRAFT_223226 [Umbelopsis ramanniana AG]